jgi:hypothetical protein
MTAISASDPLTDRLYEAYEAAADFPESDDDELDLVSEDEGLLSDDEDDLVSADDDLVSEEECEPLSDLAAGRLSVL